METIKTKYGELTGVDCGDYVVYKSVPYAKRRALGGRA